jgi:hypothetical protein
VCAVDGKTIHWVITMIHFHSYPKIEVANLLNRGLIPRLLDFDTKITGFSTRPMCDSKAGVVTEVV